MDGRRVEVVVGIVTNQQGEILLAKRVGNRHLSGLWEFPGGKVESSETLHEAIARELSEEVGLEIERANPFMRIEHNYPDKQVRLSVMHITEFKGEAVGREGQPLKWCNLAEIESYQLPEANAPILHRLQLEHAFAISDAETKADSKGIDSLFRWVERNLAGGVYQFLLRLPEFNPVSIAQIGYELDSAFSTRGAKFFVSGRGAVRSEKDLQDLPCWASGIHLTSLDLKSLFNSISVHGNCGKWARPFERPVYIGASCHNLKEVEMAEALALDYAMISPVLDTASHPDRKPLGWQQFLHLTQQCWLPCYALGGIDQEQGHRVFSSGGYGVAGISAFL